MITSIVEKTVYEQTEKCKYVILSCARYLARVKYKLCLNSRNTKYSQDVKTSYLNVLLPQSYFRKMDMTSMLALMRDILYNTNVMNPNGKLIAHSLVGNLVYYNLFIDFYFYFKLGGGGV